MTMDDRAPSPDAESQPEDHAARVAARREALDDAASELSKLRAVQDATLSHDLNIARRIAKLGFDEHTAKIFDLIPLIHVAWADGEVQKQERSAIYEIMSARGLNESSDGWVMVDGLLASPPSEALLTELLEVFRDLVRDNTRRIEVLVDLCVVVAEQHGKVLGLFGDPIDPKERAALSQVASLLGDRATTLEDRVCLRRR
ncbi:MAG: hypothetical protein ACPHRO_13150, partial [Nannocystaceae bacterium]